jgi:hypothetical protein
MHNSGLIISEEMRQFFVQKLTYSLLNPSGDWRDYQDAIDRWNYLNRIVKSNNSIIKSDEIPPEPEVDDYPLIDL